MAGETLTMRLADRGPGMGMSLQAGTEHVTTTVEQATSLPDGFPSALNSPLTWIGSQFSRSDYMLYLNSDHLLEIRAALESFKKFGEDGDLVSRDNFPLPSLGRRLDELRADIYCGKGFGLIRGLKPQDFCVEDLTIVYLGIQCYIANLQGRQDEKGNMLVHIVADDSTQIKAAHHRHSTNSIVSTLPVPVHLTIASLMALLTTEHQAFHNEEAGDIVSWLTRNTAKTGGKCIIASSHTVYNALAATRPDLVRALAGPDWPFALPRFHRRPVIFHQDGRFIMNFGRAALLGSASHARLASLPQLDRTQREALDAIESIAKATQLEIATEAGDIHFINNLAILHRREGFCNGNASVDKRHLVRMRLRDQTMGWKIPEQLEDEWDKAFNPALNRVWHLEPMPDGYFPLRTQAN